MLLIGIQAFWGRAGALFGEYSPIGRSLVRHATCLTSSATTGKHIRSYFCSILFGSCYGRRQYCRSLVIQAVHSCAMATAPAPSQDFLNICIYDMRFDPNAEAKKED